MKKIMMALAVVACAAMANAAVVNWSTSAVAFNGTKLGNQTVSLYLVGVNEASDVLFDTRTTMNSPAVNKGKLTSASGELQSSVLYNGSAAGGDFVTSGGADAGREYYMVIEYTDTATSQKYVYTSSAVASSGLSATAPGTVAFTFTDTIGAAGDKNAWVAVPEPTSGLLLLLGMAGLALKRKRA